METSEIMPLDNHNFFNTTSLNERASENENPDIEGAQFLDIALRERMNKLHSEIIDADRQSVEWKEKANEKRKQLGAIQILLGMDHSDPEEQSDEQIEVYKESPRPRYETRETIKNILSDAGRPMHFDEIWRQAKEKYGCELTKSGISSSLRMNAQLFRRVDTAIYELNKD